MSWEAWGTPDYLDDPCIVCNRSPDDCECPECPACGVTGDADCYVKHGLKERLSEVTNEERQQVWDQSPTTKDLPNADWS